MKGHVLFSHGGGEGAYEEDRKLAASLQKTLGPAYDVRYPKMPNEERPECAEWGGRISSELAALDSEVVLVGHSVGAWILLKYLSEENVPMSVSGAFLLAPPYIGAGGVGGREAAFLLTADGVRIRKNHQLSLRWDTHSASY